MKYEEREEGEGREGREMRYEGREGREMKYEEREGKGRQGVVYIATHSFISHAFIIIDKTEFVKQINTTGYTMTNSKHRRVARILHNSHVFYDDYSYLKMPIRI